MPIEIVLSDLYAHKYTFTFSFGCYLVFLS